MTLPDERWRAVNQVHYLLLQIWEDHPEYRERIRQVLKHYPGEHEVLDAYTRETGKEIDSDLKALIGGSMWDNSMDIVDTPELRLNNEELREILPQRPLMFMWTHNFYEHDTDEDLWVEVGKAYETQRHPTLFATVCVLRREG